MCPFERGFSFFFNEDGLVKAHCVIERAWRLFTAPSATRKATPQRIPCFRLGTGCPGREIRYNRFGLFFPPIGGTCYCSPPLQTPYTSEFWNSSVVRLPVLRSKDPRVDSPNYIFFLEAWTFFVRRKDKAQPKQLCS